MSDMAWPKVCARCGSTDEPALQGETVSIVRQKTEKVGFVGHNYRTVDVALRAHIFLCTECDSIANKEFREIRPKRKQYSRLLLILSLALTAVPMPIALLLNLGPAVFGAVLIIGIQGGAIAWSLTFSTWSSESQLDLSGPRRFYIDWTLNGPVRFTNETLRSAFRAANPDVRTKKVRDISRWPIEMPSKDDCYAGCCLAIIIVAAFILIWSWTSGA